MSQWCDVCNREPYRGCDSSCPIFGLSFSELAKKYFQDNIDTSKGEMKMNLHERADMVRAMEKIARSINDENVFEAWLVSVDPEVSPYGPNGNVVIRVDFGDLNVTGNVTVTVDGVSKVVSVNNGVASVMFTGLGTDRSNLC